MTANEEIESHVLRKYEILQKLGKLYIYIYIYIYIYRERSVWNCMEIN